ncbi:MAG: ABC transporter permease [Microbacteriaceae bacterium]|nr:ABC transporter permease [Microbacteriaceae bacterium]
MTSLSELRAPKEARGVGALSSGNAYAVFNRNLVGARGTNLWVMVSGFFEPVFYLLSLGAGLGGLIGAVELPDGRAVSYAAFIAPGLLAAAAMTGAIADAAWNVFFKMRFMRVYDAMLATSLGPLDVALGEMAWALFRGGLYGTAFLVVMQLAGLNLSWTAILAIPAALVVAFGFASVAMGITSYLRSFQQMDWIAFVMLPMYMLSGTFFPISQYPDWVQWIVMAFPLWHGTELIRGLTTGALDWSMLIHVGYFAVMIALGIVFATRRLRALFLS